MARFWQRADLTSNATLLMMGIFLLLCGQLKFKSGVLSYLGIQYVFTISGVIKLCSSTSCCYQKCTI